MEVTNNLEAPEAPVIDGQGEGQGKETGEVTEAPVIDEGGQGEGEDGKGMPDDPKLLRAKMTQATQESAEIKKQFDEYKARSAETQKQFDEYKARVEKILSNPKLRQILETEQEVNKQPSLKYADMSDEQKNAYNTLKPFISLMLEEMGIMPKLAQIENFAMTNAQKETLREQNLMIEGFYSKHPEAKTDPTVNKAIADIINNGLANGELISLDNAWKIYTSDSAEAKAKQKVLEENKLKKEAALPKPSGATPAPIPTGKMSRRRAVEEALKTVGY